MPYYYIYLRSATKKFWFEDLPSIGMLCFIKTIFTKIRETLSIYKSSSILYDKALVIYRKSFIFYLQTLNSWRVIPELRLFFIIIIFSKKDKALLRYPPSFNVKGFIYLNRIVTYEVTKSTM